MHSAAIVNHMVKLREWVSVGCVFLIIIYVIYTPRCPISDKIALSIPIFPQ